jgi:C4-dicarboxylate transporter DctM subunit
VAAGACTGILIPPSIAYIIIGLVLGISASRCSWRRDPGALRSCVSILVTNIIMNRLYGWEGGGNHDDGRIFAEPWRPSNPAGTRSSFRHHLLRHLLGPADADRGGRVAVVVTIIMGFILGR